MCDEKYVLVKENTLLLSEESSGKKEMKNKCYVSIDIMDIITLLRKPGSLTGSGSYVFNFT